jgi:glycosyltransferase involved in cell wall biosynthesis
MNPVDDKFPSLTLIIPVYNEERALDSFFQELERFQAQWPGELQTLFVNDGSTDSSASILQSKIKSQQSIVKHPRNRGYGAALKTGIAHAKTPLIAIADADLTYPLQSLHPLMREILGGARMAVGHRPLSQQSAVRRPAKWFLNRFASYLSATRISDLNSGLRIFHRADALRFRRLLPDAFSFTSTITMLLACEGREIRYFPIRYRNRVGSSKIKPLKDFFGFTLLVLRLSMAFQPLKVFAPLSVGLFALSLALLLIRLFVEEIGLATTIVFFTAGMQLLATGLVADLINRHLMPPPPEDDEVFGGTE